MHHFRRRAGAVDVDDPFRAGGLPATNGPSGIRSNAPSPTGAVVNTDNGAIDKLSLLSVNDIEEYWQSLYGESLRGKFVPVGQVGVLRLEKPGQPDRLPRGHLQARQRLLHLAVQPDRLDRGVFMPVAQEYFGDMSVNGVLAHEFGHALQHMANLVTKRDPTIVHEQQADCFAGVYLFWVADGKSPRFTLSTADGLDDVLAGIITTPRLGDRQHDR